MPLVACRFAWATTASSLGPPSQWPANRKRPHQAQKATGWLKRHRTRSRERSHKPQDWSGRPLLHVRMPVGLVAGQRQPQGLALRLVVRRHGYLGRGSFGYQILCGGWRYWSRTPERVKTPVTLQIPFRVPRRARFCTIDAFGGSVNGSDESTLDLLCRAKSRSWCVPFKPDE